MSGLAADSLKVEALGERELRIERRFDAARPVVFRVMTEAELVRQWLVGPPGWTMTACAIDLVVGGRFRFEWKGTEDEQMAMVGEIQELEAPVKLVQMESFEIGCEPQSGEQVATMELSNALDGTVMEIVSAYPNREARDGAMASGMEVGLAASYSALDALLLAGAGAS